MKKLCSVTGNLPTDFVEFLRWLSHGNPVSCRRPCALPPEVVDASPSVFLGLNPDYAPRYLRDIAKEEVDGQAGHLPFAETGGGDYFMLGLGSRKDAGVFYWRHGRPEVEPIRVADSFWEFVSSLEIEGDGDTGSQPWRAGLRPPPQIKRAADNPPVPKWLHKKYPHAK